MLSTGYLKMFSYKARAIMRKEAYFCVRRSIERNPAQAE